MLTASVAAALAADAGNARIGVCGGRRCGMATARILRTAFATRSAWSPGFKRIVLAAAGVLLAACGASTAQTTPHLQSF